MIFKKTVLFLLSLLLLQCPSPAESHSSGVELRGNRNTTLIAPDNQRRSLLEIKGSSIPKIAKTMYTVSEDVLLTQIYG